MNTPDLHGDLLFLDELRQRGVLLQPGADGLVCRAQPGVLTAEITERIAAAKPRLLALLQRMDAAPDMPRLEPDPEARLQPFPLTENQEAYWLGRGGEQDSGSVGIHIFFELHVRDFDAERFRTAWAAVVRRHDMLRAVVLPDGRQVVLEDTPDPEIRQHVFQLGEEQEWEARQEAARVSLSQKCYDLGAWPQFGFETFRRGGDALVLGSLDCWALDGRSLQIIFHDLAALYRGEPLGQAPEIAFRDYVLHLKTLRATPQYEESWTYWKHRIGTLPPAPRLPLAARSGSAAPRFRRMSAALSPARWKALQAQARTRELTVASLLLACYAETLAKWSEHKRFTINVPRWNRLPVHPRINDVAGEFASFSLMEVDRREPVGFASHARTLQRQVWEDLRHGHVSGVAVLRQWRKELGAGPEALVPYVFTSEPEADGPHAGSWVSALEALGQVRRSLTQTPQVWIDSQYAVVDSGLRLFWDVEESMFPVGLPDKMFAAYVDLVGSLADGPEAWEAVSPIPLPRDEAARRAALTGPAAAVDPTLPREWLERRAARTPDRMALADRDGALTWREYRDQAVFWQNRISELGVRPGEPVALALPKGRLQAVASMAVHGAGGVIVPMDHTLPQARAEAILRDCGARLLLTDGSAAFRPEPAGALALDLTARKRGTRPQRLGPNTAALSPDLYCLIYTSGSTGAPKGVMVPMRGILNMVQDTCSRLALGQTDAALSLSPLHHDLALFDIVGGVLAGFTTVFPDPGLLRDPGHWLELLTGRGVTVWNTVPAMMTMLLDYLDSRAGAPPLTRLRRALLGGDWIPTDTPPRLAKHAPGCMVVSSGGPTETTGWNILHPVTRHDPAWRSIPYGLPIQNVTYHIWDSHGKDCPELVPGELFCSGAGVTAGYLNDEDKTRRAYLRHPQTGAPMFRTGDMGRFMPEGHIEFMGRRDQQINLNGYRIELGEIEAALAGHPLVGQAVACAHGGGGGNGFLGAWCSCPRPDLPRPEVAELKDHLRQRLPRHMQPRFIGLVRSFPLNKNNKIDRLAIAAWTPPDGAATAPGAGAQPQTATQRAVAKAWRQILQQPPAHIDQNFFELGGDSIAAIRLYVALLAETHPGMQVSAIFSNPTIRSLAQAMDTHSQGSSPAARLPAVPQGRSMAEAPATHAQQRLWFESQTRAENVHHVLHFAIQVVGAPTPEAMQAALNAVAARHAALATSFAVRDGELVQRVSGDPRIRLAVTDLRRDPPEKARAALEGLCQSNALDPIDMGAPPLARASLVRLGDDESRLLLAFHHAVFDGWSLGLFMEDLAAALAGAPLSKPDRTQAHLALWERHPETRRAMEERLLEFRRLFPDGGTPTRLWPDARHAGPPPAPGHGSTTAHIPRELASSVAALAVKAGVTAFSAWSSLFGLVLARHTDSTRAQIGTYASTRALLGLEGVMGMMVNPTPLALEFNQEASVLAMLTASGQTFAQTQEGCVVPFDAVVRAVSPAREADGHPLFRIAFSQDNSPCRTFEAGAARLRLLPGRQHATALELEVSLLALQGGGLLLSATFDRACHSAEGVAALLRRLRFVAEQAAKAPETLLRDLSIQTRRDSVSLCAWNDTRAHHAFTRCLLEPFSAAAKKAPDHRPASGSSLLGPQAPTYAELELGVRRLAGFLKQAGVRPGDALGLHLSPGMDMAMAMLACWGCGAAFFPLAAALPDERLRGQAQALHPRLILTEQQHSGVWSGDGPRAIALEDLHGHPAFARAGASVRLEANTGGTPACHFFTSGSTGAPKVVSLSHANLLNRIQWLWNAIPREPRELWCAKTSPSFVDSLCEYLCPLLHGGDLYVCTHSEAADPERLLDVVARKGVTRLTVVPTLLHALLDIQERSPRDLSRLAHLTCSGEELSRSLARRCLRALPHVCLHNLYGSTEVTADAAWHLLEPLHHGPVPIGKPIANTTVAILDSARRPLPPGVPGEICVRGAATALGYLDRADGGFFRSEGGPGFATGDLGAWSHDGELVFLGRKDRQIKIRGQRVEPAEVESALSSLPGVQAVSVFSLDRGGDVVLAAALRPTPGAAPSAGALRAALLPLLPAAMIPSVFLPLDTFPLTASGKVDVAALRCAAASRPEPNEAQAIEGRAGRRLALIWEELLGSPPASAGADFFASGGHSLLAARLAARIREEFRVNIQTGQVFQLPVLSDLAAAVDLLAAVPRAAMGAETQGRDREEF